MSTTTSWFSKMLGTDMSLDSLRSVLLLQLADLKDAEEKLIEALPNMAAAATCSDLKQACRAHLEETRSQSARINDMFRLLGEKPGHEKCDAMQGLIDEADEIIALNGDPDVKDAALIAAAQRIEHYEIAGYGCARTFARKLGLTAVADLLQRSLDEEARADRLLTQIAERSVNVQAAGS